MTAQRKLGVVIVNWRTAGLTIDSLRSMEPEVKSLPWCRVLVVDNDSQDGSAETIRAAIGQNGWSEWLSVVEAGANVGFGAGSNVGIRQLLSMQPDIDYLLLLNPDTLVRPRAFRILMDFLDRHPHVGIAGGRSEDPDATPQLCCFRFPVFINEISLYLRLGLFDKLVASKLARVGIPKNPREIDWVSGAVMMIRREVVEDIGLLDEGFFLYYEETDFTLRARRAGWRCWHVPESRVVHLVGQSSGVTLRDGPRRRVPAYWFQSRRRYFVLNHGVIYTAVLDLFAALAYVTWRMRRIIQGKPDADPPHFLRDFLSHSVLIKGRRGIAPRNTAV